MSMPVYPRNPLLRPDHILRAEALLLLIIEILIYRTLLQGPWSLFALLILAPDLSLLAFTAPSKAFASSLYNLVHNEVIPLAIALLGWKLGSPHLAQAALIWLAHISGDRILGYGLKYPRSFGFTHLQRAASEN